MTNAGRNAPCPCGSGVKHKKCCVGREDAAHREHVRSDTATRWVPISDLVIDQELKRRVPRPSQTDRDALLESLKAGQQLPIMVAPDMRVLDGYTRLELLKELGVKRVLTQVVEGLPTRDEELLYCIRNNLHRRHLPDIHKVQLGRVWFEVQARREAAERGREGARAGGRAGGRGRRRTVDSSPDGRRETDRHAREASAVIAKAVGLKSGRQFERGVAVLDGPPELAEQAWNGDLSINAAYSRIRAAQKQAQAQELAASVDESSLGGEVVLGDGLVVGPEPGTVDLVVVDPPYGIAETDGFTLRGDTAVGVGQTLPDWDRTCPRSVIRASVKRIAELLKSTGSFYLCCDRRLITFAWEEAEAAGLVPRNTVYWVKSNAVPSGRRNWSSAAEAILYGVKGKAFAWNLGGDAPNVISAPIVGGEERAQHPTQKPLSVIERLIEASSNPGDLVVDFMAGSGTTGVAARRRKRRFVLVEREEQYVAIARARLATEPSSANAEADPTTGAETSGRLPSLLVSTPPSPSAHASTNTAAEPNPPLSADGRGGGGVRRRRKARASAPCK